MSKGRILAKETTSYICTNCGHTTVKWLGKCPGCNAWNSLEAHTTVKKKGRVIEQKGSITPQNINEIEATDEDRIKCPGKELNRVLGGGIVAGAVTLIGGEPGIGKSTLMLQTALRMNKKVLYITGEESNRQVKLRANRIGNKNEDCYLLPETEVQQIVHQATKIESQLVIIDSIQTLSSKYLDAPAGSISQLKECTHELIQWAKKSEVPVFLIGHITKDGNLAGPKILEHMVDTVLQFEGDRHHSYRILRTIKNRFGSASELGLYEMTQEGMREVNNPSEILLSNQDKNLSGIAVAAGLEGMRPLLVECQALVSTAVYGTPQRNSNGYDIKRLNMLLAVLEKKGGMNVMSRDVFVNIAGGLKMEDPGIDLAIAVAIVSAFHEIPLKEEMAFCGEIGLSGEVRPVQKLDQRVNEAAKLGFKEIVVSNAFKGKLSADIKILKVENVEATFRLLFG